MNRRETTVACHCLLLFSRPAPFPVYLYMEGAGRWKHENDNYLYMEGAGRWKHENDN